MSDTQHLIGRHDLVPVLGNAGYGVRDPRDAEKWLSDAYDTPEEAVEAAWDAIACTCEWRDDVGDPEVGPDPYIAEVDPDCPQHGRATMPDTADPHDDRPLPGETSPATTRQRVPMIDPDDFDRPRTPFRVVLTLPSHCSRADADELAEEVRTVLQPHRVHVEGGNAE
jgi:hypothetical protein